MIIVGSVMKVLVHVKNAVFWVGLTLIGLLNTVLYLFF